LRFSSWLHYFGTAMIRRESDLRNLTVIIQASEHLRDYIGSVEAVPRILVGPDPRRILAVGQRAERQV
jgi:hypothetical protein